MTLLEIRDQLDEVDQEITRLYKKRMDLCAEVARVKIGSGKAVFDPKREAEKLDTVASYLDTDFDQKAIRELYQQMMNISRRLQLSIMTEQGKAFDTEYHKAGSCIKTEQDGVRVVYQGVEGAYAEIAAREFFTKNSQQETDYSHVETWKDALDQVMADAADYAVLPIENSSHGAVTDNFDLLLRYPKLSIIGELDLPVAHALMSVDGASISGLREVYSHAQALGQCRTFFENHPTIKPVPVLNTAVAARLVRDRRDPGIAALASVRSAEIYGLRVMQYEVNESKSNTTRFAILGKQKSYTENARKISLCFETAHKPGALYNVLGNFVFNDVNMLMIQSRPIPEKPFQYRFFVDIEGRLDEPKIINVLNGMQDQTTELRILGCY